MNYHKELDSLYKQMESELHYLKPAEKHIIKKFMLFAFDRGESSVIERLDTK